MRLLVFAHLLVIDQFIQRESFDNVGRRAFAAHRSAFERANGKLGTIYNMSLVLVRTVSDRLSVLPNQFARFHAGFVFLIAHALCFTEIRK